MRARLSWLWPRRSAGSKPMFHDPYQRGDVARPLPAVGRLRTSGGTSLYQRWDVFVPAVGRVTCEALQGEGRIPLERSFASLHVIPPAVIPKTRLDLIDYQCAPKRNPKSTDD